MQRSRAPATQCPRVSSHLSISLVQQCSRLWGGLTATTLHSFTRCRTYCKHASLGASPADRNTGTLVIVPHTHIVVDGHQVDALSIDGQPVELLLPALQDADGLPIEGVPVADLPVCACSVDGAPSQMASSSASWLHSYHLGREHGCKINPAIKQAGAPHYAQESSPLSRTVPRVGS